MSQNSLFAIVLSIAVIFGWSYIGPKMFPQYFPHPQKTAGQKSQQQDQVRETTERPAVADNLLPIVPVLSDAEEKEIGVDTNTTAFVLAAKGAAIKSIKLHPMDALDKIDISLIHAQEGPGLLALTELKGVSLENDVFSVKEETPLSVVFKKTIQDRILCERRYQFFNDGYHFDITTQFTNLSPQPWRCEDGYQTILARSIEATKEEEPFTFATVYDRETQALEYEKVFGKDILKTYTGHLGWAGVQNKYFTQLFWSDTIFNQTSIRRFKEEKDCWIVGTRKDFELAPGETLTDTVRIYAGPRELDILKNYSRHLEKLLYMGVFGKISMGLLIVLKYLHGVFKSYGIAIIILTLLVKVLLHPLTHKSFQSMKVQKDLAPKIAVLKEKHKNDPQKAQKEMMELYRKEGVNPLSGCLPVVFQLPVFFALFSTLRGSFELRHESFLWVPDLASKDPIYILPLLTLGLTVLQQKMTPSTGDKQQQMMMMIFMVIFMSMMVFSFPAGLLIYWFASSLISLLQQKYYFRSAERQSQHAQQTFLTKK